MSRLLHRSKSTKELRTKYELPDEEVPRLSAQCPPHTPNKLTRRRAGTIIEPKQLSPSKSVADFKVTIHKGAVVASPKLFEGNSAVGACTSNTSSASNTQKPYMDSFPPRTSSKVSLNSSHGTTGIGVAIGSPTREKHMFIEVRRDTPEPAGHSAPAPIQSFYLPAEPFDLTGEPDLSGKQGNSRSGGSQETRGGWRRFFGRALFGRKGHPAPAPAPAQAQAVHVPVIETPSQPKHTPLISTSIANKPAEKQGKDQSSSQLLDVDIPTVEMERYSIMFRALLRDEGQAKTQLPQKPTIYDRRRSRDTLNGGISKERPKLQLETLKRHATTGARITAAPQIPDSPTPFSLPLKSSEIVRKNTIRLGRSNTTAALTRDARPGPGFVLAGTTPDTDTIPSAVFQEHKDLAPFHPAALTPRTARDSVGSQGSRRSNTKSVNGSFDEGDDTWLQERISQSADFSMADEKYNIAPSMNSPTSLGSTTRHSFQGQSSPQQSSPKQSIARTEEELIKAAQESIKRQITLSQKQLLLPVVRQRPKPGPVQTSPDSSSNSVIND